MDQCFNIAKMISQYFFDLSGLTISPPNPHHFGWKSAKKAQVTEVCILCYDNEIVVPGKLSQFNITSSIETQFINVF